MNGFEDGLLAGLLRQRLQTRSIVYNIYTLMLCSGQITILPQVVIHQEKTNVPKSTRMANWCWTISSLWDVASFRSMAVPNRMQQERVNDASQD